MKSCEHVDSLLSAYLENETSPAETRFLEDHFDACARCRTQKNDVRSLMTRLHSLPRVETSEDFTRKVLARTVGLEPLGVDFKAAARSQNRLRPAWTVPLAAAAAAAILVVGISQMRAVNVTGPAVQEGRETAAMPSETFTLPTEQPQAPAAKGGEVVSIGNEEQGEWLDAYVLEDYELRTPAGGGSPTLTRVAANTESKVVVTF